MARTDLTLLLRAVDDKRSWCIFCFKLPFSLGLE